MASVGVAAAGFRAVRVEWAGVARAISPDARFRHPAFRSLEENLAPQSLLRSVSYAARLARATPPIIQGPWNSK